MKGFIFTNFLDFVEKSNGLDMVDEMLGECDLASEGVYSAFNSYEFDELVTLLTYVSNKTGIAPQVLLEAFGRFVFPYLIGKHSYIIEKYSNALDLIAGIENSKAITFDRVLYALGIRYVGETVAKKLAQAFGNMVALKRASFDELIDVEEIGEKIAISVLHYFQDSANLALIDRLKEIGLSFETIKKEQASAVLIGKVLVVSGTFETFSRDEIKELIERNGGKVGSSVSSKTDFLIAGANMGPAKLKTATNLGVVIISEDEFIKLIS